MDEKSVVTAYRRLSRQYDRFFGPVFEQGREVAVRKMDCNAGDRVLEVGVGTGLSLDHYADDVEVVGIDHGKRRVQLDCRCLVNGKKVLIGEATVLAPSRKFD